MKLVVFIIIIVIACFGIHTFIGKVKISTTLITYNGRTCSYWEERLWPDEYIHGWYFKSAKLSPKIVVRTGVNSEVTPPQAAAIIDWVLETYPVCKDGASLKNNNETEYDSENKQTSLIWRFDKAPSKGVTDKTQKKMINDLLSHYKYMLVDKWPLQPERFIDDVQKEAKDIVSQDLLKKGF